jgi:glycosyltransferase involved in cell wall biosynthesis
VVQNLSICHVNFAKGFRGGERQTQLLIQALAEAGIPQILVARSDSPLHSRLREIKGLTLVRARKPYFTAIPNANRLAPSIVHAHDGKAAHWAFLNWRFNKTPYLITRRVPNELNKNIFTLAVYRNASVIVALSNAIKYTIKNLLPETNVQVIPSMYASFAVNEDAVDQLRKRYAGKFVIGHIAALVDRSKGQSLIIKAAENLAARHPDIHFVLLGNGKDERRLKTLAKAMHNVEFAGFVADVGNWIRVFDLFVFPSHREGLGSTLLDVMQGECPIIASATDGILDVIEHELNGLLVPAGNAGKLAAAIERLYADPDLRDQFVRAGLQRLGLYSPQRISGKYLELYQSLLS